MRLARPLLALPLVVLAACGDDEPERASYPGTMIVSGLLVESQGNFPTSGHPFGWNVSGTRVWMRRQLSSSSQPANGEASIRLHVAPATGGFPAETPLAGHASPVPILDDTYVTTVPTVDAADARRTLVRVNQGAVVQANLAGNVIGFGLAGPPDGDARAILYWTRGAWTSGSNPPPDTLWVHDLTTGGTRRAVLLEGIATRQPVTVSPSRAFAVVRRMDGFVETFERLDLASGALTTLFAMHVRPGGGVREAITVRWEGDVPVFLIGSRMNGRLTLERFVPPLPGVATGYTTLGTVGSPNLGYRLADFTADGQGAIAWDITRADGTDGEQAPVGDAGPGFTYEGRIVRLVPGSTTPTVLGTGRFDFPPLHLRVSPNGASLAYATRNLLFTLPIAGQ